MRRQASSFFPLAVMQTSKQVVGVEKQDESTHTCKRMHISADAFAAIADILERIRKHDGCLDAPDDWFNEICPPHP